MVVLNDSPCEISENGRLIRFWKRTDRWCAFSWNICDKNCYIVRYIENDSFWGYVGIQEPWQGKISKEEPWAKVNTDRKRSSYIQKDYFERTECTLVFKILFPQRLSDVNFTNPISTVGLQLLNLWLLKVMLRCVNDGVTNIKPRHQTTGKRARHMVSWVVLHAVPYIRKSLRFWGHPRKPTILNAWVQQYNTGEVLWWFGQQYRGTVFWWSHYYPLWPNHYKGTNGRASHDFRTTMQFSRTTIPTFTQLELFSHGLKSMKVNFNIFPGQQNHQISAEWGTYSHLQHLQSNLKIFFKKIGIKIR
jgi:hypothetical protein